MTSNKSKSVKKKNKNTLYLVFRLNGEDRRIIHGMYDEPVFMKNTPTEGFEETEMRIGSELYWEVREVLDNVPTKFDLSGDIFEGSNEEIIASTQFLSNDTPSFISPCAIEWSDGSPVHFFSNVDVLILPSYCVEDVSGIYDNDEGDFLYVKRIGAINAYGNSETLIDDIISENHFEVIFKAINTAKDTIKTALLSHIEDLHLFMLPPEWEDRDEYAADPNLPPRITLTQDEGKLIVHAPNFTFYSSFMEDEEMRMAYFKVRFAAATWLNIPVDNVEVSLNFGSEIAGFKVAKNVWVEALRDDSTATQGEGNRFWWNSELLKSLKSREQNAQTMAAWLLEEGANRVAYYSLVEHDAGDEVAYSVSVFKDRKRIMMFMISAFDIRSGFVFMGELQEHLGFPLIHSGEKEDDWGVILFENDFSSLTTFVIEAPRLPASGFCVIGLYFKVNGEINAISPNMLDLSAVPELLSLGLNAPLPFTGVLSSPCYVKADELVTPLILAKHSIEESQEDDLALTDPRVAEKLAFDLASNSRGKGTAALSVMLLNISQNTLFDYAMTQDFPVGEIQNENLLKRLNAIYPSAKISSVVMTPLIAHA